MEELYYPSSENKGADQLRGYREADLRLCFRLCRLFVFPRGDSFNIEANSLYAIHLLRTKLKAGIDMFLNPLVTNGLKLSIIITFIF